MSVCPFMCVTYIEVCIYNPIIFYIGDDDVSKKEELNKNKNGIIYVCVHGRVCVHLCVCICVCMHAVSVRDCVFMSM